MSVVSAWFRVQFPVESQRVLIVGDDEPPAPCCAGRQVWWLSARQGGVVPGSHRIQGEATALPFADRSMDVVVLTGVHQAAGLPAMAAQLAEAGRVAGTHVLVVGPHRREPIADRVLCLGCGQTYSQSRTRQVIDEARVQTELAGFSLKSVVHIGPDHHLAFVNQSFAEGEDGWFVDDPGGQCPRCHALGAEALPLTVRLVASEPSPTIRLITVLIAPPEGRWRPLAELPVGIMRRSSSAPHAIIFGPGWSQRKTKEGDAVRRIGEAPALLRVSIPRLAGGPRYALLVDWWPGRCGTIELRREDGAEPHVIGRIGPGRREEAWREDLLGFAMDLEPPPVGTPTVDQAMRQLRCDDQVRRDGCLRRGPREAPNFREFIALYRRLPEVASTR